MVTNRRPAEPGVGVGHKKAGVASKRHLAEGFWELPGFLVHGVSLITLQIQMRNLPFVCMCVGWRGVPAVTQASLEFAL